MKLSFTLLILLIACKISFAQDTKFPDDYPSDLPKPQIVKYSGSEKLDNGIVFLFETNQSVKEAMNFFTAEMPKAGYNIFSEAVTDDAGGSSFWEKGNKLITLLVLKPDGFEQTSISISITNK